MDAEDLDYYKKGNITLLR